MPCFQNKWYRIALTASKLYTTYSSQNFITEVDGGGGGATHPRLAGNLNQWRGFFRNMKRGVLGGTFQVYIFKSVENSAHIFHIKYYRNFSHPHTEGGDGSCEGKGPLNTLLLWTVSSFFLHAALHQETQRWSFNNGGRFYHLVHVAGSLATRQPTDYMQGGPKKVNPKCCTHNFVKYWPILKILSPLQSPENLQCIESLTIPPHLKRVATLPCEMFVSEN